MTARRLLAALALGAASSAPAAEPTVTAVKTANEVAFVVDKEPFTTYHTGGDAPSLKPGDTKPIAKPFFFPLTAPGGVPVTRGWPLTSGTPGETADHPHQKSAWFCHGDVIPEGLELKTKSADPHVKGVDFWSETAGHGRIVCVDVGEPKQVSASHVVLPTKNEWRTADGVKLLDEARTVHVLALPAGRLVVIESDLYASVCPVTFGDTKEGAMGVRVHDDIRAAKGKEPGAGTLANAAGKMGEKDVWGYEADWCDYSGPVGGKVAGIAVFDGPKNPHRAAWHARGYGLMAANPFGRGGSGFPARKGNAELVKVAKGDHLELRYGIYTHAGDAAAGKVAEAYQAFAAAK